MTKKRIYRVVFAGQDKVYELLVHQLFQSDMVDFLEVEDIILPDDSLANDPLIQKLLHDFSNVKRCYIPMHAILRIDELEEKIVNVSNIVELDSSQSINNVTLFPRRSHSGTEKSDGDKD